MLLKPFSVKRKSTRRLFILMIIFVVILFGVFWFFLQPDHSQVPEHEERSHEDDSIVSLNPNALKNVGVRTERVTLRNMVRTLTVVGTVQPDETRLIHLRPLARGRIIKVFVRSGDRVRQGQPILIYDNIELGELIGDYLQALAHAEVTRRAYERAKQLVETGAIAQAEYERREAGYHAALADIEKIRLKMRRFGMSKTGIEKLKSREKDALTDHLSLTTLRAPRAGTIIQIDAVPGEIVEPDEVIGNLADLSRVWVQARIYEKDLAFIQEGQPCQITVEAYPARIFYGIITYVSDFFDPATRTARVRCEVDNAERLLRLEMFATIHLSSPSPQTALMVPESAIQWIDNEPVVFVQTRPGVFQKRAVIPGNRFNGWIEIRSGLSVNESVVIDGGFYLKSTFLRARIGDEH